ncbi:MAG: tyrosine-type recombinase/integrase [Treponema sp.]|nr:tyrosine-type recombinase/integrase [Treponema sp.]
MPRYRQTYTLFKRGKFFYYRTYTAEGVRTTAHSTGCTSLTAARVYCDRLFLEGKMFAGSGMTFRNYAAGFFDKDSVYAKDNGLSPRSIAIYSTALENDLMPLIGCMRLTDVTYSSVKSLRQTLLDKGLSPSTVKLKMATLHIILKSAFLDGIISKDPFDNIRNLKGDMRHRDAFTLDEVKLLFEYSSPVMQGALLLLALTGMRISELAGVSAADVKYDGKTSYIKLERQYIDGEFAPLKTKRPRDIPLSPLLVPFVDGDRKSLRKVLRKNLEPQIRKIPGWKERLLCPHSLRHFFISSAKSYGINHLKVEAIAGHSLKGIQETYTTFHVADLAEIVCWQEWAYTRITGTTV